MIDDFDIAERHVGEYFRKVQYRPLARDGKCRGCWKTIPKLKEKVIFIKGLEDNIILCDECSSVINFLSKNF